MTDNSISNKHFELAVGISLEALKALLYVNGGAAVALIALTDKSGFKHDFTTSVLLFGLGALLAVAAFVFGYYSQLSYSNSRFWLEHKDTSKSVRYHKWHLRFQKAVALVAFTSIFFGVFGVCTAFFAARS